MRGRRWGGALTVRRLTAAALVLVLLAPGWFPLTALTVDGTDLLRSDHGCACGRFSSCCCEMFVSKAERERRARAGETGSFCHYRPKRHGSHGSHDSHAARDTRTSHHATHEAHETHDAHPSHGTHGVHGTHVADAQATEGASFCDTSGRSGEPPEERAATLDFRTWVGPSIQGSYYGVPELSGRVASTADSVPLLLCDPPETPPPRPTNAAVYL